MMLASLATVSLWAAPAAVTFTQPGAQIDRYDFVEVAANVHSPAGRQLLHRRLAHRHARNEH